MKKYLYKIVLATLILMSTTVVKASNEVYYTNKRNVEMTEAEYNNLLGLGFTEKDISRMDQELFNENKDLEGSVLQETTKYFKTTTYMRNGIKLKRTEEITREEAMREKELHTQNPPSRGPAGQYYDGIVGDTVYEITAKIIGLSNTFMRYQVRCEWLTMPDEAYYDIIGIGMEPAKVQFGSIIVFRENWTTTNDVEGYTEICSPVYTSTGGFAAFALPTDALSSLDALFYYNVRKQNNVGTITSLYAGGDYAHATSYEDPEDVLPETSITYMGLIINYPYSNSYDSQSAAIASFIGTW